jgi:hypothetical protein
MRLSLFAIILVATFGVAGSMHSEELPRQKKAASSTGQRSDTKSAVHIVLNSSTEAKKVFTYFPSPIIPAQYRFAKFSGTGIYRMTLDPPGNVTEIKILKRIGVFADWPADVTILKTLVRWRAQPGPLRTVDIPWTLNPGHQLITNEGSHIPRH